MEFNVHASSLQENYQKGTKKGLFLGKHVFACQKDGSLQNYTITRPATVTTTGVNFLFNKFRE